MFDRQATAISPQLAVRRSAEAVEFYKAAFGATVRHRVENAAGEVVCQLQVDGAEFWVSEEAPLHGNHSPESLGGATTKMLHRVEDPEAAQARAVAAGATEVYPVRMRTVGAWPTSSTPTATTGRRPAPYFFVFGNFFIARPMTRASWRSAALAHGSLADSSSSPWSLT
jgi:PhnB protein